MPHIVDGLFASALVLGYGLVFLHLAAFVLASRKKARVNYIFAALLSDFGLMCLVGGAGAVQDRPAAIYYELTFAFLLFLGPLTTAYVMEFIASERKRARTIAAIAWTAAVLAIGLALGAAGAHWRRLLALAYAHLFLLFTTVGLVEMRDLVPLRGMARDLRVLFVTYWGMALELLALGIAQLLLFEPVMHALWLTTSLTLVAHGLLVNRDPDMYRKYERITAEVRLSKTRLAGLDIGAVSARLDRLMAEERLYRVANLQLEDLAQRLGLSGPQLSELLNRHLGKSYSEYINGLRIAEARRMLLERRDLGILDVCFECGFSSKSSFNAVFKKETGRTPSEFREKSRGEAQKV